MGPVLWPACPCFSACVALRSGHSLLGDAGAQLPPSRHPGCPPAATVPPQPKVTFGTEILPKQPPLPPGCPEDAMAAREVNKAIGSN